MENKYCLSKEENLLLAKKLMTKSIYSSARLEGIAITYPETQAIIDGINVTRVSSKNIKIIKNLKSTWDYVLDNIDQEVNLDLICQINSLVLNDFEDIGAGLLRDADMEVSGKNILPPPEREKVLIDLEEILKNSGSATQQAIEYFLYGCINQLFFIGNKRAFMIAANMILIKNGAGVMVVDDKNFIDFNLKLLYFYNTHKSEPLKELLYTKCLIEKQL